MIFDCACCEAVQHSRVQVEERGRKATFLNPGKQRYVKIQFDGCVCKDELAADWIISRKGAGQVIVELKGRDIEHGFKQINATAAYLVKNDLREGKIAALIVGSQIPKISTTIQRAKLEFARSYRGKLMIKSSRCDFEFDLLLGI